MIRCCLLIVGLLVASSWGAGAARAQEQPPADASVALPTEWSTYYVVLLREGPAYADERPADSLQALMSRHIQYQLRLQQSGQALAGGGFGEAQDGVIGLTLLRAASLEEAARLARADPAVAAGRLSAVVYAWYVPAGRLPE